MNSSEDNTAVFYTLSECDLFTQHLDATQWLTNDYGGKSLRLFHRHFMKAQRPLSLTFIILGVISNLMNVLTFTRRQMRSPGNCILISLALTETGMLVDYLLLVPQPDKRDYLSQLTHHIATTMFLVLRTLVLLHTVLLSLLRYMAIRYPTGFIRRMTTGHALTALATVFVTGLTMCIPIYMLSEVRAAPNPCNPNETFYRTQFRAFANKEDLVNYSYWFIGTACRLIPCLLLILFNVVLTIEMHSLVRKNPLSRSRKARMIRLARIAQAITALIVAIEAPQGIMNILTGILGNQFGIEVHIHLTKPFELMTLMYSCATFPLYCAMDRSFRESFRDLVCHRRIRNTILTGDYLTMAPSVGQTNRYFMDSATPSPSVHRHSSQGFPLQPADLLYGNRSSSNLLRPPSNHSHVIVHQKESEHLLGPTTSVVIQEKVHHLPKLTLVTFTAEI